MDEKNSQNSAHKESTEIKPELHNSVTLLAKPETPPVIGAAEKPAQKTDGSLMSSNADRDTNAAGPSEQSQLDPSVFDDDRDNDEDEPKKKGRSDFYIELALFLILGVLLGIAAKTEASKKITIGYNDYQMAIMKNDYNFNKMQADLADKRAEEEMQQMEEEMGTEEQGNVPEDTDIETGQ
jgi:hypothetical protein